MIKYYVRVSTIEQRIDRQLSAYDKADKIYMDKMSGKNKNRPQLQEMLESLTKDDVVVAKSLDRLSRSTKDLFEIIDVIKNKGAKLKILDMNVDTSTPQGEFFLTIMAGMAELERKTIVERTKEGVAIAKAAGKYRGRQEGSITLKGDALKRFIKFYNLGLDKSALAKEFNTSRPTIYRWIETLKERKLIK